MTMQDTNTTRDASVQDEIQALRDELAELRAQINSPQAGAGTTPAPAGDDGVLKPDLVTDRRHMLRRAGAATAAAVAGGAALAMSQASPAAAANGNSIIIGANGGGSNTGTLTTELRSTGKTGTMGLFVVQDGTVGFTLYPAAIQGFADGTAVTHGVYGYTSASGGTGVVGVGDTGVFASGTVDLRLGGLGSEPSQASPDRAALNFTANDNLWFCTSNAANSWVHLAGPSTAGSLHMLPVPKRVYDSRPGTSPNNPNKTPWASTDIRTLDATFNSSGVPTTARAVMITATATNTNPGGFFGFWASGAYPGTSSLNWGAVNSTVATTTVVGLDGTGKFKGYMLGVGGSDLVIDVVGYYQ